MLRFQVTGTNLRHCLGKDYSPACSLRPAEENAPELERMRALYETQPVHALRPEKDFHVILKSWNDQIFSIWKEETFAGYLTLSQDGTRIGELVLEEEGLLWDVAAAVLAGHSPRGEVWFTAFSYETQRIRSLMGLCESYQIQSLENLQVFSFERVVRAFFRLKAAFEPLPDGAITLELNGEKLALEAEDGQVSVTPLAQDEDCDLSLNHHQAVSLLFGASTAFCAPELPAFAKVWFPLPALIHRPDQA